MNEGGPSRSADGQVEAQQIRKVCHPFQCRLTSAKAFDVNSPQSLVGAGFASLGLAIFSTFRLAPFVLYFIASNSLNLNATLDSYLRITLIVVPVWTGTILFVLIGTGIIQLLSTRIKRQGILLIHPWCLLLLYVDVFVWIILGYLTFMKISVAQRILVFKHWYTLTSYVVLFFIDTTFFFFVYYMYATYFIVAELTVIEKFFQRN